MTSLQIITYYPQNQWLTAIKLFIVVQPLMNFDREQQING